MAQSGGHREKVSVAAALWLSPRRDRLGLYFQTLANGYFDNWYVAAFLEAMLQELAGRFVVVWDGGTMHKGDPIRPADDPLRRPAEPGAAAAVGADAQPGRAAVELAEVRAGCATSPRTTRTELDGAWSPS